MTYPQPPRPYPPAPAQMQNGYGVAAFTLGLFSLIALIPIIGAVAWFLWPLSIVFGILGLQRVSRGQANNRGLTWTGIGLAIIGMLMCFAWLAAFGSDTARKTAAPTIGYTAAAPTVAVQPPAEPTTIKVKSMGDDFEANQVAAEAKWGGQYVQFTAPVGNINSDGITFTDVTSKMSLTQISCGVSDPAAVVKLVKGKPATVRGIVGDDQTFGVIRLNDCEIV